MSNYKLKWIEKLNAFASIIAILGGLAGFYKLFSTNKDLQKQITNLTTISQESVKQTKIMYNELNEFKKQNKILVEQLVVSKTKLENDSRPDFIFELDNYPRFAVINDTVCKVEHYLINKGGACYLNDIIYNKNNSCRMEISKTFIPSQSKVKFNISFPTKGTFYLDIYIVFKDIEDIYYKQRFHSNKVSVESLQESDNIFEKVKITSDKPIKIKTYFKKQIN